MPRPTWTAGELAEITGGTLLNAPAERLVTGISTDSRSIAAGEAFLAIRGERFDGAVFAEAATAAGAAIVITESARPGFPAVVVPSALDAYAAIARHHLARLRHVSAIKVVGITGSSGKTSTKDLLVGVLTSNMNVIWPAGSLNNDIGLPATVLRADAATDVLVLEMGMRGLGHIQRLCQIAPPDISVVLNVGLAHVGEVGSIEGIATAKSEIVRFAREGATAVLNADDVRVRQMGSLASGDIVYFGFQDVGDESPGHATSANVVVRAVDVMLDEQARAAFALSITPVGAPTQVARVHLPVAGAHQVHNALAVAAVAQAIGMSCDAIARELSSANIRSNWRMDVVRTRAEVVIVNDAYNANPQSMAAGLQAAAAMSRDGRLLAVLGDMLELGELAPDEHRRMGELAASLGVERLVFVGQFGADVRAGFPSAEIAATWGEAAEIVKQDARAGDVVFIKASRGVGLERVAEDLVAALGRVDS